MSTVLGPNSYGKAETRLVRVSRDGSSQALVDLNVSVALAGDLAETHLHGDNTNVLPTDTQKNTVYAFARSHGVSSIEAFGELLARHFVDSQPTITRARVSIEEYAWNRLGPHSFQRAAGTRTAAVTYDGSRVWVVSGVTDLVLLNSTGSEFHGFVRDGYTTLQDAHDRILATAVQASWRHAGQDHAGQDHAGQDHAGQDVDWSASFDTARAALVGAFVTTHSLSLQQTLYAMGQAVIDACPEVVEVRLSLPNKHHFLVDLAPFDLDNPGEVYFAADRPYGLIEGTVLRDGAPPPGPAWSLSV